MHMKISTSLEHGMSIAGASAQASAAMMCLAGFDGVDLSMCHDQETPVKILSPEWAQHIHVQAKALKAEGLEIAQCHLPYYPGHIPLPGDGSVQAFEDFMLSAYIRAIQICGEIGCPVAVLHPFFDLRSEEITIQGNVQMIEKMLPYLQENQVKLALENVYAHDGNYVDAFVSRPTTILRILEQTDPDYVGACIDTGHANIFRIPIGQMARTYGKRLFALHVNGNAGADEHVIPYTMSDWCERMDFHDFSAALKEIGYSGYYNLEIDHGNLPATVAQPYLNYAAAVARALADMADS